MTASPALVRLKKNYNISLELRAEFDAFNEGSTFQGYFHGIFSKIVDKALQKVVDAGYSPLDSELASGITITEREKRVYLDSLL